MASDKVHMVQQIIKYSDGTETVINYRGVIEKGILDVDKPEDEHFSGVKGMEPSVAEGEVAIPEGEDEKSAPKKKVSHKKVK